MKSVEGNGRESSWKTWGICLALALVWQGAGWVLLAGPGLAHTAPRSPAIVPVELLDRGLLTQPMSQPGGEATPYLWSSALFALPSPVGFSRTQITDPIVQPPPVQLVADYAMTLARERRILSPRVPDEFRLSVLDRERFTRMGQPMPAQTRHTRSPARERRPAGLQVRFLSGWSSDDFLYAPAPDVSAWAGPQSWHAEVHLRVDQSGYVQSVVLSRPAELAAVNETLARHLRTWRAKPGLIPAQGRVSFDHWGAGEGLLP